MKAIILAAGQGTRIKKYTQDLPKGMLVFQGKTIIEQQIELYRKCGIEDIIIVRGYAADKINYDHVRYYSNAEYRTTNMLVSLLSAKAEFTDDVIVSYSDILFHENMLRSMKNIQEDFAVAVDINWEMYWMKRYGRIDFDTESLVINENDYIDSIGLENPPADKIDARYIGLLRFSEYALSQIVSIWERDYPNFKEKPWQQSGKCIAQAYMTDLLNALIQEGYRIKAVPFCNGWIEFDTNEDYEEACQWVRDGSFQQLFDSNEMPVAQI